MFTPKGYQLDDADWAFRRYSAGHKAAFLWHDPGTGKSCIAVLIARQLIANTVLILCPAIARENWRREIQRWQRTQLPVFVVGVDGPVVPQRWLGWIVVNYERLQEKNSELLQSLRRNWDLCVIDEHHYASNPEAQRTEILYRVNSEAQRLAEHWKSVLLMSGTPIRNSPLDLWGHLYVWAPGTIFRDGKRLGWAEFRDRYCETAPRQLPNGVIVDQIIGGRNEGELIEAMRRADIFRRRVREDVIADLPHLHAMLLPIPTYGLARDKLDEAAQQLSIDPLDDDDSAADRLQDAAEDPAVMSALQLAALQRTQSVVELTEQLLFQGGPFNSQPRKALLFAHHAAVMDELTEFLRNAKLGPVEIRGGQTPQQRQRAIDLFQNEPRIRTAVVQLQAGSTAVNLTAATDELFVELDWTATNNTQCMARGYRLGQENAVQVRLCLGTSAIERAQQRIVARRLESIEKIAPDLLNRVLISALRQREPEYPPMPFGSTDDWLDGPAAPSPVPAAADADAAWLE